MSGANAGITYGAHGIRDWHLDQATFPSETFSSHPFRWQTSLRFPGAWSARFSKGAWENYELYRSEPWLNECSIPNEEVAIAVIPPRT